MDGKSSREKGARGELEFRDFLRERGYSARRYGRNERADADLAHNVEGVHFEVKRRNTFEPVAWLRQARRDAAVGETPVVVWKRNQGEWVALLGADEFLTLLKERAAPSGTALQSPPLDNSVADWEGEGGA